MTNPSITPEQVQALRLELFALIQKHSGISGDMVPAEAMQTVLSMLEETTLFALGKFYELALKGYGQPGGHVAIALDTHLGMADRLARVFAVTLANAQRLDMAQAMQGKPANETIQ